MAVFLVNTCKFNSCGITFPTLTELIRHIEETHLDFDPRVVEEHESQQPSCLPISYILRVFADNCRKESVNGSHSQPRKVMRSHSPALSLCSTTPTGSEMDEEDNGSDSGEESMDSWVNNSTETDSTNAIIKIMNPHSIQTSAHQNCDEKDRPYVCTNGNCKKRYRNANGLKYHTRNVHKNSPIIAQKKEPISQTAPKPVKEAKEYKCICGKVYKTSHGLKHHKNIHHNNTPTQTPTQMTSQTQTQTAVQTQTTQTSSSVQTNTTLIGKSPIISGQTLSQTTKESILATFVRCRTLSNGSGTGGLPLMLTLQTDNEIKTIESDSVTKDDKKSENAIKCPAIAAPTLQQHLLSPMVGKSTISVTKIL